MTSGPKPGETPVWPRTVKVHVNVDAEALLVTREKFRLALERRDQAARAATWARWLATVATTTAVALASSSFQDFLLPRETWREAFALACAAATLGAAGTGAWAWRTRRERRFEALWDELKGA